MKKLLVGASLCALLAAPALAAEPAKVTTEPVKLSLSEMDGLTAGFCAFSVCTQINVTHQTATAVAVSGSSLFSSFSSNAAAGAANYNSTFQSQ